MFLADPAHEHAAAKRAHQGSRAGTGPCPHSSGRRCARVASGSPAAGRAPLPLCCCLPWPPTPQAPLLIDVRCLQRGPPPPRKAPGNEGSTRPVSSEVVAFPRAVQAQTPRQTGPGPPRGGLGAGLRGPGTLRGSPGSSSFRRLPTSPCGRIPYPNLLLHLRAGPWAPGWSGIWAEPGALGPHRLCPGPVQPPPAKLLPLPLQELSLSQRFGGNSTQGPSTRTPNPRFPCGCEGGFRPLSGTQSAPFPLGSLQKGRGAALAPGVPWSRVALASWAL